MQLIATQEFDYNGKNLKVGDEFEAPDLHGKIFIQNKRAKAKEKVMSTKTYETAAMTAPQQVEIQHNPRGKYKKRDMRSEQ